MDVFASLSDADIATSDIPETKEFPNPGGAFFQLSHQKDVTAEMIALGPGSPVGMSIPRTEGFKYLPILELSLTEL